MNVRSARRSSAGRLPNAMLMLFLACSLVFATGCATETVYLVGDERIHHVQAGQPAPITGWLMSDRALAELYDALEWELSSGQAPSPPSSPEAPLTTEPARKEP